MAQVDSDIRDALDEEREYANSQARYSNRLQLDRGDTALVRFLPVQMGSRKQWFLRVGRHWVNKRPYFCKRTSSPDIGGDPDYACPLCEMCEEHMASKDEDVANEAFRASANPQWVVYCIVWERGDRGREPSPVPKSERYIPYETWLTRDAFLEVSAMMKRSRNNDPQPFPGGSFGILDPKTGCDIWVTKDKRGVMHFDKMDPAPIDDKDSVGLMAKILSKVKLQEYRVLSGEKMDDALDKLEDTIQGRRPRRGEDDRRGGRGYDQRDEGERRGGRRSYEGDEPESGGRSRGGYEDDRRSSRRVEGEEPPPPPRGRRDDGGEPSSSRGRREEGGERQPAEPSPSRGQREERQPAEPSPSRGREEREAEPPRRSGRSTEPLDDNTGAGGEEAGGEGGEPPGEEPPPSVRASPPPSVRRGSTPPPARGKIQDDQEEMPSERRDAAPPIPTAADAPSGAKKSNLGDAVRRGVRAVQDAVGEEELPPPRRSRE